MAKQRQPDRTFTCVACGTIVTLMRYIDSRGRNKGWYNSGRKFCSVTCRQRGRHIGAIGYVDKNGYRIFNTLRLDGRTYQISEHRLVMERLIGRELLPTETVHHLNGQRSDNRPENLELWDKRHGPGQRVSDKIAWALALLADHGYLVTPPTPA